jgi:hypothetical protein
MGPEFSRKSISFFLYIKSRDLQYGARRTTHDARRTTKDEEWRTAHDERHKAMAYDARRRTHNERFSSSLRRES